MKDYVKFIDGLPWIAKILVALFLGPLAFGIYRIAKGKVILGLLCIFIFFWVFVWVDLISILLNKKLVWLV
jgi:NhaP-type Na+/H+ and K+/H+ antiporter